MLPVLFHVFNPENIGVHEKHYVFGSILHQSYNTIVTVKKKLEISIRLG